MAENRQVDLTGWLKNMEQTATMIQQQVITPFKALNPDITENDILLGVLAYGASMSKAIGMPLDALQVTVAVAYEHSNTTVPQGTGSDLVKSLIARV